MNTSFGYDWERMKKAANKLFEKEMRRLSQKEQTQTKQLRLELHIYTALKLKAKDVGLPASKVARELLGHELVPYLARAEELLETERRGEALPEVDKKSDYTMMTNEHHEQ
ncbi:MAG: hypothetical protein ACYC48_01530 [Minisyncoccota bacterium]